MSDLKLYLLGSPRVELDGLYVEINRNKGMALLAYLAFTGEPHRRDALGTLLWPERSQRNARENLRRELWLLRAALADEWFTADREMIGLRRSPHFWLDVDQFQQGRRQGLAEPRLTRSTDWAMLAATVQLYRGDFLSGFTLPNCPAFDEWQFFQTEQLRRSLAAVLEELVIGASAQGHGERAIDYAQRWLALDSLHEPVHRHLMALYAQCDQPAAAFRQYQLCVELLKRELNSSPSPETTALYEAIRVQKRRKGTQPAEDSRETAPILRLPDAARSLFNFPTQPTPFVGRQKELADVTARLADPGCRLLTLVGPGGVGKSRLALQAVQTLVDLQAVDLLFPHGIYFVQLAEVSSPGRMEVAIAEAVKFTFYRKVSPREQLLDYLRTKTMLLVLDNFEHLFNGTALISTLLASAPTVKILVTSQAALNLQEEWFHAVTRLPYPETVTTAESDLAEYDAIQLFVYCARRAHVGFSLEEEEQAVVQICRLVEGLPLGIELAAAWRKVLSCDQIAYEIAQSLDFLTTHWQNLPERHRSLRAVFEHTWCLLSGEERTVLMRLALFRSGFQSEAAYQVADASLLMLAGLVEKSLLRASGQGHYQMHELLRQFAEEKLQTIASEWESAHGRHSHYCLTFLEGRERALHGRQQQSALAEISAEIENVRAGWHWAIAKGKLDVVERAIESLYEFYEIRSRYAEGMETFGEAVKALQTSAICAGHPKFARIVCKVLARQGAFCLALGLYEAATMHLQQSYIMACKLRQRAEIAFCLAGLGEIAGWHGEYAEAQQRLQESLALNRALNNQGGVACALYKLAEFAVFFGEYAEAKRLAQSSLVVSRELGCQNWIASALDRLGLANFYLGEYYEAEYHYQESLTIFQEIDNHVGMALAFGGIGWAAWAQSPTRQVEALAYLEKSLAICRERGHRLHTATRLYLLGLVTNNLGDYMQARHYFQETLTIAHELQIPMFVIAARNGLGDTACGLDDLAASHSYLTAALQESRDIQFLPQIVETLVYYATLLVKKSRLQMTSHPDIKKTEGEKTVAAELLAFVLHQRACWRIFRERATHLQRQLAVELPEPVMAAAQARGESAVLQEVVTSILQKEF